MTTTTDTPAHHAGFVGSLTRDPELRFSAAGIAFATARIGVRQYVPKGEPKPEPIYRDVVTFGSLAENFVETCHKGDRLVVSGRMEQDRWIGSDGAVRTTTKLVADAIGPDLRFTTVQINRRERRAPADEARATGITALLGPDTAHAYTEEPF